MARITKKIRGDGQLHFFVDVFHDLNTNEEVHINTFRNRVDKKPGKDWTKEKLIDEANRPKASGHNGKQRQVKHPQASRVYEAMTAANSIIFYGDVRNLWKPTGDNYVTHSNS